MITIFKDPYYMNSKTKQILQNQKNQYVDKQQTLNFIYTNKLVFFTSSTKLLRDKSN